MMDEHNWYIEVVFDIDSFRYDNNLLNKYRIKRRAKQSDLQSFCRRVYKKHY